MKIVTSKTERLFVHNSIKKGLRQDGRGLRDGRSIDVVFAEEDGCCIVMQGDTRVLAQVSCEITAPRPARPAEGALHVNLELSPMADPDFKSGAMSDVGVEASRLLERCIRDSRCVDLESLCVVAGMKVWTIRVDVQALNNAGNLIECASIATICALSHFKRPHISVVGTEVTIHSLEEHNPVPLTMHHMPVIVNLAVFDEGEVVAVDPLELEERVALGKIVVGVNAHQEICLLHLSGPLMLKKESMLRGMDIAMKRAQALTQVIRKALDDDVYKRAMKQPTGFVTLLKTGTILGARRPIARSIPKVEVELDNGPEEVDMVGEAEVSGPSHALGTSVVKEKVQKFLESSEGAVFEGGNSRWEIVDTDDDEDEDNYYTETAGEKSVNPMMVENSDDSNEEEEMLVKSEHLDPKNEEIAQREWYSKDAFF